MSCSAPGDCGTGEECEGGFCYENEISCNEYNDDECKTKDECEFTPQVEATCTGDPHCVDDQGVKIEGVEDDCLAPNEWIVCNTKDISECNDEDECEWNGVIESSCKEKDN